ncbi:hypothetical protein RCL1_008498 [Eukaryota sp. TZLM3-RCL]
MEIAYVSKDHQDVVKLFFCFIFIKFQNKRSLVVGKNNLTLTNLSTHLAKSGLANVSLRSCHPDNQSVRNADFAISSACTFRIHLPDKSSDYKFREDYLSTLNIKSARVSKDKISSSTDFSEKCPVLLVRFHWYNTVPAMSSEERIGNPLAFDILNNPIYPQKPSNHDFVFNDAKIKEYFEEILWQLKGDNWIPKGYFYGIDTTDGTDARWKILLSSLGMLSRIRSTLTNVPLSLTSKSINRSGSNDFCSRKKPNSATEIDYVFVDEASLVNEVDILPLFLHLPKNSKIVQIGDHEQLKPFTYTPQAPLLATSFFERIVDFHGPINKHILLDTTFPLNPILCTLISKTIYDDKLFCNWKYDAYKFEIIINLGVKIIEYISGDDNAEHEIISSSQT